MPAIIKPSAGPVSSPFGYRRLVNEPTTFHGGIDYVGALGSTVRATKAGTVVTAAPNGTYNRYGNLVVIKHTDPREAPYSLYAHLNSIRVRKGQIVRAGQPIGTMGNTSASAGDPNHTVRTHLHFELLKVWPAPPDVGRVNPAPFLVDLKPILSTPALYPVYAGPTLYAQSSPLSGLGAFNTEYTLLVALGFGLGWLLGRRTT